VAEKLAILSFLCDRAIQNEKSLKEVSVRFMAAHEALVESTMQRPGDDDSDWNLRMHEITTGPKKHCY
jgi:hypothetical protein